MNLQVLVSTMNQLDKSILHRMHINSDIVIINQTNRNLTIEFEYNYHTVKWIDTSEIGLSKSRNMALREATGDICILTDDDVIYSDDFAHIIKFAFKRIPDADMIAFNATKLNITSRGRINEITKLKKVAKYKGIGMVCIAFRLKSLKEKKIVFNENFGPGSIYSSGEDSLMFIEANKKGLNLYEYPAEIATVDFSKSSWFNGYNEEYFYNIGAWLSVAYPKLKYIYQFYYIYKLKRYSKLSAKQILLYIKFGFKGYKEMLSFKSFINRFNNNGKI